MGKSSQNPKIAREFSAGGVVFKKEGTQILWLVTQSNPSDRVPEPHWRLPKGWIDNKTKTQPGEIATGARKGTAEEIQNAALREVREEGGIEAKVIAKLGTTRFFFRLSGATLLKFVTFYLMEWVRDRAEGPDEETQAVEWLPFPQALKRLDYSTEKEMLKKANGILGAGIQENLI